MSLSPGRCVPTTKRESDQEIKQATLSLSIWQCDKTSIRFFYENPHRGIYYSKIFTHRKYQYTCNIVATHVHFVRNSFHTLAFIFLLL